MRRERKIFMILLALLLLPAIYLTIDPEFNRSERYLKLSLQDPVEKFNRVKKKLQNKETPKPKSEPEEKLTPKEHYERLHRAMKRDFSIYSRATSKKWKKIFSEEKTKS